MNAQWGFVGCGNMAQSIITGILIKKLFIPTELAATDISEEKLINFSNATGISKFNDNISLVKNSEVIVLATKPQDILTVLGEIRPFISNRHTLISIAAGVSSQTLLKYFHVSKNIFRIMPNTPALIQKGVFGIYQIKGDASECRVVEKVFATLGLIVKLKSDKEINAVTAGSASGVGFVLLFMEEFEKWFLKKGFTKAQSRQIVVETFKGTAELALSRSEISLKQLREAVTSKKGTTHAGLTAMKNSKISPSLQSGLEAAFERGEEIAKSLRQS